jgi:hypothetical protein
MASACAWGSLLPRRALLGQQVGGALIGPVVSHDAVVTPAAGPNPHP